MKTPQEYEQEIAELKRLIGRMQKQLTLSLETLAKRRSIPVLDRLTK